MGSVMRSVICL